VRLASATLLALLLAACGSAASTQTASTSAKPDASSSTATPSAPCAATVASTLGGVAERVYHEAATGGDVEQAVHRAQSSAALVSAVNSGNASAAGAALRALLLNQIVRIEVLRGGRVFATAGSGSAIAPVSGSIPGTGASFILSVQADRTYLQVAQRIAGAQILLLGGTRRLDGTITGPPGASVPTSGPLSLAGQSYEVFSLTGAVYPSGPLRVAVLVPSAALSCPGSTDQARVETLGHVGERIYQEELHSQDVSATLRHIEGSVSFQRAVAAADPEGTRAAIEGFFRQHIHVVRVRVTIDRSGIGQRLLVDVGGPFVLAPVPGTVRSSGRVVGHFTFAIQDDAGYLKLTHLFTGAEVLMRTGRRQVMGTLSPGPASVPARGEVAYGGRVYDAYSFTGEAFPSGPLRLSLLITPEQ
jgi:hypothetical protein